MPLAITPTFSPWMHTSDDSYIYQLSLVLATATVSFSFQVDVSIGRISSSNRPRYYDPAESVGFVCRLHVIACHDEWFDKRCGCFSLARSLIVRRGCHLAFLRNTTGFFLTRKTITDRYYISSLSYNKALCCVSVLRGSKIPMTCFYFIA